MREQRNTVSLVKLTDEEVANRPAALAHLDGYADAMLLGTDGFFCPTHYNRYDRSRYLDGFHKGLRVRRLRGE